MALLLALEVLKRSDIIMRVMGRYVANDTMLQWSNQLVLVAENELFNDGIALNEEGARGFPVQYPDSVELSVPRCHPHSSSVSP